MMRRPNVVILIIDTLREDYSQGLERLGDLGFVRYENAIAPAPWTLPSHVSMITGQYPSQHQIHEAYNVGLEELVNISREGMQRLGYGVLGELRDYGYETYVISANPFVSQDFGFKAMNNMLIPGRLYSLFHFRLYNVLVHEYGRDSIRTFLGLLNRDNVRDALVKIGHSLRYYIDVFLNGLKLLDLTMEKGSRTMVKILNGLKLSEPFFMVVNMMEAHSPYFPNDLNDKLYNSAIADWILGRGVSDGYLRELRFRYGIHARYAVDRAVEIVRALSRYLDNTLFIVTSDHGELLGDGGLGHGYFVKDGLLRVPLWIRWPNWFKAPKQTKPLISLTEVPSIIRMVINNNDSHEVGSSIAITESFGLTPFHKIDIKSLSHHELMKHFSHKIRVYTGKCVFTYNKSMDLVEESSCEDSVIKRIIDVVRPYAMSE